jgi:glycosyltransferase involved in cell wall biosynthesis
MKILQVVPFFSPFHGGSSVAAYMLSVELARAGNEVTVLTSDSRLDRGWVESEAQVEVRYFKTWTSRANSYFTPTMINFARKEIENFDLIHMHNYRTYQNIVTAHYAARHRVPYVLQPHGSIPWLGSRENLKRVYDFFFGNQLLKNASKVVALTPTEARQCKDKGLPDEKVAVIPNGVVLSDFSSLPSRGEFKTTHGIPENKRIVLYLGRMHKIKGIDLLVRAWDHLTRERAVDDVILTLVGPDDGYLHRVHSLIGKLRLDKSVLLIGPLYEKDKIQAYVDAEFCVLPSRYETFSYTVLEAYACSKAVVTSNVEGLSDLVMDGRTGLLFQSENVEALRQKLMYMLTNPLETAKMGKEGRTLVEERFDMNDVGISFKALYQEMLEKIAKHEKDSFQKIND